MNHHKFTQQYFDIIRDTLQITSGDSDEIHYYWDENTGEELTRRLENHMNAFTEDAIKAARQAASDEMYSFHFGLSPHLNETLKYAPLYTDHVVLQDGVYRSLRNSRENPSKRERQMVLMYIKNIMKWGPLIESGHVSILPSPYLWSSEIRQFLSKIDTGPRQTCTQPLLASNRLQTTPFTDAPEYGQHMSNLARTALMVNRSAETGEFQIQDPTVFEALEQGYVAGNSKQIDIEFVKDELDEMKIINVASRLFGDLETESPKLYYLNDASFQEVIELAEEFEGFRRIFNEILDDLVMTEGGEVEEIVEKSPERIQEEYQQIEKSVSLRRDAILGSAGVAGLAISLPLFVQLSPQDLLTTSYGIGYFGGIEELLNVVIDMAGGISGGLALERVASRMSSDEFDFYNVIAEFDESAVKNSHVESLWPI